MSTTATCNQSMLWNWYTIDSCFLAESWHISSNGAFAATCIGTILLVMVMEALRRLGKEYDEWILRGFQARVATFDPPAPSNLLLEVPTKQATTTKVTALGRSSRTIVFRASPLQQIIRSILHAVSLGVAYIVMLLVMSYNGYVIVCVIIGGGLGKFFCDWMTRRVVLSQEGEVGSEGRAAGLEEPSVCCG